MKISMWLRASMLGAAGVALAALLASAPRYVIARGPLSPEPAVPQSLAQTSGHIGLDLPAAEPGSVAAAGPEVWKLGVTQEASADYTGLAGRVVSAVAAFRSNHGASDIYYIFPAAAITRTVQSASFNLLSRSGAYPSSAILTLKVFDMAGVLQRTVSAAGVGMQSAALNTWTTIGLSSTPANLTIAPGQFLAFHFQLGAAPGGDLDARPTFEVVVQ